MNKEQKSKEYAELKVKQYNKNHTIESYGINRAMQQLYFDGYELQDAFEEGWDEALKSKWINAKECLPKPNTDVIFLTDLGMIMNGCYDDNVWMQMDGFWGSAYTSIEKTWKVIAWMPIPSFDEILEENKDVLKRLKDK